MRALPLLGLLAGCVNLDLDPDPWLIRDWLIDEPRVVGVRAWPPVVEAGRGVALQALAVSPRPVPDVRASLCGLREDREVLVETVGCFRDESLVEPLADALPATWTSPDIREATCDVDDLELGMHCVSVVPVLFEAGRAAASDTLGIAFEPPRLPTPPPRALSLFVEDAATEPGERVRLVAEIVADEGLAELQWWVDGGELLESGRTQSWIPEGEHQVGASRSENELEVPLDWSGPLRVVAVARGDDLASSSWAMTTIHVGEPATDCSLALDVLVHAPLDSGAARFDGDLYLAVRRDGQPVVTTRVEGVDLARVPLPLHFEEVPCAGPATTIDVDVFVDTDLDADPDAPQRDETDPYGRVTDLRVDPGALRDVAVQVNPR